MQVESTHGPPTHINTDAASTARLTQEGNYKMLNQIKILMDALKEQEQTGEEGQGVYIGGGALLIIVVVLLLILLL